MFPTPSGPRVGSAECLPVSPLPDPFPGRRHMSAAASDGMQPGKGGVSLRRPLKCTLKKLLKFLLELSDPRVFQEGGEQIHYGCDFDFTPG